MKREYILAATAILIWGSSAAVSSLMMDSLSSATIVLFGGLFAAIFLFLTNLFTGRLKLLRTFSLKDWCRLSLLGLLGMFLVNTFFYFGLGRLKAQQAFIINYLWPILTVAFSCLLLGQRMTAKKAVALLLSFFGVIIVSTEGSFAGLNQVNFAGVAACVAAAVCYALFSVLNMKLTCDKFVATMIYYMATSVAALFPLLAQGSLPSLSLPQWSGLLWIGMLVNGLAYAAWAAAMDLGDTAKLSNLAYLTPFLSLVYIFVLLHEPIHPSSFVGLLFILSGVVLQISPKSKSASR